MKDDMTNLYSLKNIAFALVISVFSAGVVLANGYPQTTTISPTHISTNAGANTAASSLSMAHYELDGGQGGGNNSHLLLEDESVVYPNPTEGPINIRFEQPMDVEWVQAFNTLGQRIHPPIQTLQTGKVYRVDLSGFTPGIYFLRVKVADQVHVKRVILR